MEPAPDKVDLSALDPSRDPRWDGAVARIAARGRELLRLRRAVVRRGAVAFGFAAAAAIVLWISVPQNDQPPIARPHGDLLDWATRDVGASDVLGLGGNDAH